MIHDAQLAGSKSASIINCQCNTGGGDNVDGDDDNYNYILPRRLSKLSPFVTLGLASRQERVNVALCLEGVENCCNVTYTTGRELLRGRPGIRSMGLQTRYACTVYLAGKIRESCFAR